MPTINSLVFYRTIDSLICAQVTELLTVEYMDRLLNFTVKPEHLLCTDRKKINAGNYNRYNHRRMFNLRLRSVSRKEICIIHIAYANHFVV